MDFLINSQVDPAEVTTAIRHTVEMRLARYTPGDHLDLADLWGIGKVKEWAEGLVKDIQLAKTGRMPWSECDDRKILIGQYGVGKRTLVGAIAHTAGIRLVEFSASRWAAAEDGINHGVARLYADFQEALTAAPAIFFIHDMDVFADMPWTPLLPYFLECLEGIGSQDQLLIIAGALTADNVRFELRHQGRLEECLLVPSPNAQALSKMYAVMLRNIPHTLTPVELNRLGRLSLGLGEHEVGLIVRRAERKARKENQRPLTCEDITSLLIQERYGTRAESGHWPMTEEELRNTAYHEAGHTILQLMRTRNASLDFASVIPREDGKLGFIVPSVDETRHSLTRQDLIETIRVWLAGRAAEEVLAGKEAVTSGCSNDLYHATRCLQFLLTGSGLESLLMLNRDFEHDQGLCDRAEEILRQEYTHVLATLRKHRKLLDQVAQLLIDRQEVSGEELMDLYRKYQTNHPGPVNP